MEECEQIHSFKRNVVERGISSEVAGTELEKGQNPTDYYGSVLLQLSIMDHEKVVFFEIRLL